MVKGAVLYKGIWLAPGSTAFQLYQDRKTQELDKQLKESLQQERDLIERYKEKS